MPRIFDFSSSSLILATLLVLTPARGAGVKAPDDDPLDWDSLMAETEDILDWSEDPLADLFEKPEKKLAFWSTGFRAGPGYSDNFLKRPQANSSNYLKAEAEFLGNILFEKSAVMAMLYAEHTRYDSELEADSETVLLFTASWTRFLEAVNIGIETNAFYGDQIFDASLTVDSEPEGTNLRQLRSQVKGFLEWSPASRDLIKASAGAARAAFGDNGDDYWESSASVDWTHGWNKSLQTTSSLVAFAEFYDEDVPREADGGVLDPETALEVHGIGFEQSLEWQPAFLKDLKLTLKTGATGEFENEGNFKELNRFWASLNGSWKWRSSRFALSGKWQRTRYTERESGFLDDRPLKYAYRHLKMEWVQKLPWNLSVEANLQWSSLKSRAETDSFSEKRMEILLGWTY